MFHKNAANSLRNNLTVTRTAVPSVGEPSAGLNPSGSGPRLVSAAEANRRVSSARAELIAIASRRCSSFFAEAAVLVLVFGLLDFFLQRGRMEMGWVAGALLISVLLLAASVFTDFSARRWLGAHP